MTATLPELSTACQLHSALAAHKAATETEERAWRASLLRAVAAGATRVQIQTSCNMKPNEVESALRQARAETDDPELAKTRTAKGGLTLGEYWCPEKGCPRSQGNGNEPLASAQALGLHRQKAHGYHLGEKPLTAAMVKRARRDADTPTSVLARRWGISTHALGAARSGKTWKRLNVDAAPRP